ncbi:hypothetical protein HC891_14600 [Candidatus Gracilibacteria bacterium]|nr:hypothetical protein [Candidatus Gracilibacteria bacterium]
MARVPWSDTIWIQRTLDAGALGLVVPMVNTAADAAAVVRNMRYATRGQRSFGGSRVAAYIDGDYRTWADDHLAIVVMIETIEAVRNADAILAVEGVTGCFIGPNDLALSMGITMEQTGTGSEHEAAMLEVLAAAKRQGKAAGKHCFSAAEINVRIGQGFQFLALASDGVFMARAAQQAFDAINLAGTEPEGDVTLSGQLYGTKEHRSKASLVMEALSLNLIFLVLMSPCSCVPLFASLFRCSFALKTRFPMPPLVWTEVALHPEALARLEAQATVVATGRYDDLPGVEAAIIGGSHVSTDFIERAGPQLKMVVRHGIGYNTLDVPTATRYGVLCCNTPDAPTESTAEHTVGLMLAVAKVIVRADRALRNNDPWVREDFLGVEVRDRVLGVIGCGRIGRRVAEICALGLQMQVLIYDPFLPGNAVLPQGVRVVGEIDEVIAQADFLTLHTPLSAETQHLIGERELRLMKRGACLLNVSRGPVVDEAALIRALADGHLGGAGLDVFDPEPPDPKNPLLHMSHVVVTPHVASFTDKGVWRMSMSAVDQVLQVLVGERPAFIMTRRRGRGAWRAHRSAACLVPYAPPVIRSTVSQPRCTSSGPMPKP